jgi:hypothetical protein
VRIADRDHELPDAKRLRVPEFSGDKVVLFGPEHREIGERVSAHHLEHEIAPIRKRCPAA